MILIIDNYDSFTFNLYQVCATIYPYIQIVKNDCVDLHTLHAAQYRAIIISPGPGSAEQSGLCIPIVQKFSGTIPILGICLGHQIIAKAFGGVINRAPTIVHGKKTILWHNQKGLFTGITNPLYVARYHSLIVKKVPFTFIIDARSADESIMSLRHKTHLTYGLQFHPESYLCEEGSLIISNFLDRSGITTPANNLLNVDT